MTLDELILEAVRNGLQKLTLWKVDNGFQANASVDGTSWRVEIDPNPARALRRVLGSSEMPTDSNGIFD